MPWSLPCHGMSSSNWFHLNMTWLHDASSSSCTCHHLMIIDLWDNCSKPPNEPDEFVVWTISWSLTYLFGFFNVVPLWCSKCIFFMGAPYKTSMHLSQPKRCQMLANRKLKGQTLSEHSRSLTESVYNSASLWMIVYRSTPRIVQTQEKMSCTYSQLRHFVSFWEWYFAIAGCCWTMVMIHAEGRSVGKWETPNHLYGSVHSLGGCWQTWMQVSQ